LAGFYKSSHQNLDDYGPWTVPVLNYLEAQCHLKKAVFCDVAPCRSSVNPSFGGTSVHTKSTRRHTPEDGSLYSHRRENIKPYTMSLVHFHFLLRCIRFDDRSTRSSISHNCWNLTSNRVDR
jgi:hypothetical protein